jgi:CheY-like chemotaxis protein
MTQMQGEATTTNHPLSILTSSLLVVDDNSMNRIMLSPYITKLGYQATLAGNGRQALEKLQGEPFDLVLLGYATGPGLTTRRKFVVQPKIRVIFLHSTGEDASCKLNKRVGRKVMDGSRRRLAG